MLFDAIKRIEVNAIPNRLVNEWQHFTNNITALEQQEIITWVNSRFDEVASRIERVQPSGWLGSGFNWHGTSLYPIYRECRTILRGATDQEIEERAGQIFGLFVSLTLSEHRGDEVWYFVKSDEYQAHGVPIRSRIYFLPNNDSS